jgi:serine phosphatase RsbU (regulator of sigma subunit)
MPIVSAHASQSASLTTPSQQMVCMEVWGGNRAVDSGVVMAGLDAWVYSRPYGGSDTGGDVHYVSSCATGRVTRLLVADVSGHGDAVAGIATSLRELMRRNVNYIDQTRFVRQMNREFGALSQDGNFATAIVTTFFAPTGDLTVCNAGHPPPLVYRAKTGVWSLLKAPRRSEGLINMPLGILALTGYEQFGIRLRTGDMVLCFTDSLTESRGIDGEMLGEQGLLDVVSAIRVGDPATLISRILDAIRAKSDGNLTDDDVTALLFRSNGLRTRMTWSGCA